MAQTYLVFRLHDCVVIAAQLFASDVESLERLMHYSHRILNPTSLPSCRLVSPSLPDVTISSQSASNVGGVGPEAVGAGVEVAEADGVGAEL